MNERETESSAFPVSNRVGQSNVRLLHFRKETLEKFKQTDLRKDFINYKKSVAIMRRELHRIKQNKFRSFCEGFRFVLCLEVKRFQSRYQSETANEYSSDKIARILEQIDELRIGCVYNKTPSFGGENYNEFLNL